MKRQLDAWQRQYLRDLNQRIKEAQEKYNRADKERNWFEAGKYSFELRQLKQAKAKLTGDEQA